MEKKNLHDRLEINVFWSSLLFSKEGFVRSLSAWFSFFISSAWRTIRDTNFIDNIRTNQFHFKCSANVLYFVNYQTPRQEKNLSRRIMLRRISWNRYLKILDWFLKFLYKKTLNYRLIINNKNYRIIIK